MRKQKGYSREDSRKKITSVKPFSVIENNIESLIGHTLHFARLINYYNSRNLPDGHFDELLDQLKDLAASPHPPVPDGIMEPSQALLYTFIEQLHSVNRSFNDRWNNYADWYLRQLLGVVPQPAIPDKVWVAFYNDGPQPVQLEKGTVFNLRTGDDTITCSYRLPEDLTVENIRLEKIASLHWERNQNILPAAHLGFITSVRVKNLLDGTTGITPVFGNDRNPRYAKALGLIVSSPSLLLREGKRCVTITFQPENDTWISVLSPIIEKLRIHHPDWSNEKIMFELFYEIFYITISTAEGWAEIEEYTVKMIDDTLVLRFILAEDFPGIAPCTANLHDYELEYPAVRLFPNFDAWLYPYSWLKHFMLHKIIIDTALEDVGDIRLYNELGMIDNSKPFAPFGLNTDRGAWFVIGNYEMSIKNVQSVDLQIRWQQLPSDNDGLHGYYRNYDLELNNRSFRLRAGYLSDYDWHDTTNTEPFYLFSTLCKDHEGNPLAASRLSETNCLSGIRIERMVTALLPEEEYEYNIRSRTGFIRFVLEEPEVGFGNHAYRRLFTDQMIKKAHRRKHDDVLNPPLNPVIEKITLNYHAIDVIDLRKQKPRGTEVFQLYPFGQMSAFSDRESQAMPFLYHPDTDANILFSFGNVKGGEIITLFLDFYPINNECTAQTMPRITWYWGNGYSFTEVAPNTVLEDTTRNLITSGHLKIRVPDKIDPAMYDADGSLWLRAGISRYYENISALLSAYVNVAPFVLDTSTDIGTPGPDADYTLVPEKKLTGIGRYEQITPFYDGKDRETAQDMQIRVSQYITHRGRAVTARDYEYIVLQAFPDVGKAMCLHNYDCKEQRNSIVSIVVIPETESCHDGVYKPLASSYLLLRIEEFLSRYISAYVQHIDALNPLYEELFVRCDITFYENYSVALCKTKLNELFNHTIAPWQEIRALPDFGYAIDMQALYNDILKFEFIKHVNRLSVIRVATGDEYYELFEYRNENISIKPLQPHVIFIPAPEHIIEPDIAQEFGINEMSVNETFIIG